MKKVLVTATLTAALVALGASCGEKKESTSKPRVQQLDLVLDFFPNADHVGIYASHDRWFLDRVCTHVLAFEGNSQVEWFEGNFDAWERRRRERLGEDAERPHRITYKRLTRA